MTFNKLFLYMSQLIESLPDDIQDYIITFLKPVRINRDLVDELLCVSSLYKLSRVINKRADLYNNWASWYNAIFELTGFTLSDYIDDPIIQSFDSFYDMYELFTRIKWSLWFSTYKKNLYYLYPLINMPFIQHFFNEETGLYETKVCHRSSIIAKYEMICFCRFVSNYIDEEDDENDEEILDYLDVDEIKPEYIDLTEEEIIKNELIACGVPHDWV